MFMPTIYTHWTGTSQMGDRKLPNSVEFVEFPAHYEGKRRMLLCVMLYGAVVGPPLSY